MIRYFDEYMSGKELLLAPIVYCNAEWRYITLPPGKWYSFEHGFNFRVRIPALLPEKDYAYLVM